MEKRLFEEFKKRRGRGQRCGPLWLSMRARKLVKDIKAEAAAAKAWGTEGMEVEPAAASEVGEGTDEGMEVEASSVGDVEMSGADEEASANEDKRMLAFQAKKDWRRRFCRRFKIARRRRTNNKGKSKGDREAEILQWHVGLYQLLRGERAPEPVQLDEKWGRFTPAQRINVDQSPLGFISGLQDTYAEKGPREVWISTPSGSSLEKRQCTLQVCYAADVASGKKQCKLALIFRGEGKRITELERLSWDKRVDVYFQTNAWADRALCLAWLERTYGPWAKTIDGEKLLLMDNLDGQVNMPFREQLKESWDTLAWYFKPNCTDLLQPVDRHIAQYLKSLIAKELENWLEDDDNLAKWESGQFTASERRVLLTLWSGEAYEKLCAMLEFLQKSFLGSGCLLTVDLSDVDKVAPQNMPGYGKRLRAELLKVQESGKTPEGALSASEPAPPAPLRREDEEYSDQSDLSEAGLDSDNENDDCSDVDPEEFAAFFLPARMQIRSSMPPLDKKLLKTAIMFKWATRGWQLGRVKRKLPRNEFGFNFKVYYGVDDREASHCFGEERYVGGLPEAEMANATAGSWVALQKAK
ncbi:hypothetical protein CYMTET_44798 [Cymbomonas tetramitiformis]|uniref:DDE-1 domain-containing protein n=1 Tax=Cymbomonas tetramitiformis TaxID=36881 RepID=A0AAE0EYZ5_9CHLO|nr:hypothetical protein CYMTET_44798 [Cymbomonas tetramitiformis]